MKVKRTNIILKPDYKKVLLLPFTHGDKDRIAKIIAHIISLSEKMVQNEFEQLMLEFFDRHLNLQTFFLKRFEDLRRYINTDEKLSKERKMLIGAYFSHEYSLESAALFNPSIVWHPDQSGLIEGKKRFVLSLRATGEGHISSITFRSGIIDNHNKITLDKPSSFVTTPEILHKTQSDYEVFFRQDQDISKRVIFPSSDAEKNGIEDARFVKFCDRKTVTYYATYTAYDGRVIRSQLLETQNFLHFKITTLHGSQVKNKGMALFPKKINNLFAMISRQDNENLFIMFSQDIQCWDSKKTVLQPKFPWEFVQLGNCGSPIETEAGWLVLVHGVGPMRKYAIGAVLLDLKDPVKVIGRLKEPLLTANENEREGYVPNVVYSCGSLINNGELILPYAISDRASTFATIALDELLTELTDNN